LEKIIIPEMKKEYEKKEFNFRKFYGIKRDVRMYMKLCGIWEEEIPHFKEFKLLYENCYERNNQEYVKEVVELRDENNKFNLFKLNKIMNSHVLEDEETSEKVLSMITGKYVSMISDIVYSEYRKFYEEESNRIKGNKEVFTKQSEYQFFDRNRFTYEIDENEQNKGNEQNNQNNENKQNPENNEIKEYKVIETEKDGEEKEEQNVEQNVEKISIKKSFLRKVIDRVIKTKKITLEEVDKEQLEKEQNNQVKLEKGEESLEK
jgi:hypothetical protein